MTIRDTILGEEDPIAVLGQLVNDIIYEDPHFITCCSYLVLRDMDLPIDTVIGADPDDGYEHYLLEDDPKYPLYWEQLVNVIHLAITQSMASERGRYTLTFHGNRVARKIKETQGGE